MTTLAGITPLGQDVQTIIATDTPFVIVRPTSRIKTVRGGLGGLQNQDGGGTVRLDYTKEQLGGGQGNQQVAFNQLTAAAVVMTGDRAPKTFVPGDVNVALNSVNIVDHRLVTGDGPFRLTGDDLPAGIPGTPATGILTLTANVADAKIVTIDTKVYTFQTVLTNVDGNVLIGASASDSLDNLIAAITLGAGAGTLYATATTFHPTVTAAAGAGDTMDATAKSPGSAGNSIATTETLDVGSWGAVTLENGADADAFVIRVDDDNFQFATTRQNALDGIAVDLTDAGTGTHSMTGLQNVSFAPVASVQDGSGAFILAAGGSLVLPANKVYTLVGDTNAVTQFFFI